MVCMTSLVLLRTAGGSGVIADEATGGAAALGWEGREVVSRWRVGPLGFGGLEGLAAAVDLAAVAGLPAAVAEPGAVLCVAVADDFGPAAAPVFVDGAAPLPPAFAEGVPVLADGAFAEGVPILADGALAFLAAAESA